MTTVYNQHTFGAVAVGPTGHQHERAEDAEDDAPTAIDCDECAPFLLADGWTADPALVPLTDRQVAEKERRQTEGSFAIRQAAEALAVGLAVEAERQKDAAATKKDAAATKAKADTAAAARAAKADKAARKAAGATASTNQ